MQHPFGALTQNFRLIRLRKFRGQQPIWNCRRWQNTISFSEMLDELERPSLEARRDRSSLFLFHKIHSGVVSIEKDKYLTHAHSLKSTRASHNAQYCRYQTYSDALKNSLFLELFDSGIVFLLQWSIPGLLRNLGHSSFSQNTAENFFPNISKFARPGVMIKFDRVSITRKTDRPYFHRTH